MRYIRQDIKSESTGAGRENPPCGHCPSECVLIVYFFLKGHPAKPLTGLTGVRQKGGQPTRSSPRSPPSRIPCCRGGLYECVLSV